MRLGSPSSKAPLSWPLQMEAIEIRLTWMCEIINLNFYPHSMQTPANN